MAELRLFGASTANFAFTSSILVLVLLVADVTVLAPGLSVDGWLSIASLALLFGIGVAAPSQPAGRIPLVFFVAAALLVVALTLLQLEEQPSQVFGFHLAAMAPVVTAAFARWSLRWHVGWLVSVFVALGLGQAVPFALGYSADTTGQFLLSFAIGSVVSVAVLAVLTLERYRSHILLARVMAASARELRAQSALAASLSELQRSQLTIRKLEGILPTCASCGKVRTDDDSEWLPLADYLTRRGAVSLSHGYCPDCYAKAVAEFDLK